MFKLIGLFLRWLYTLLTNSRLRPLLIGILEWCFFETIDVIAVPARLTSTYRIVQTFRVKSDFRGMGLIPDPEVEAEIRSTLEAEFRDVRTYGAAFFTKDVLSLFNLIVLRQFVLAVRIQPGEFDHKTVADVLEGYKVQAVREASDNVEQQKDIESLLRQDIESEEEGGF